MSTVAKLLGTIEAFLANAGDNVCVWLDFCAVNQHDEFAQNKEDVNKFEACLKQCKGGTLVVVDVLRCNPATRGWCLYEWDHTLLHHGPDGMHMRGMRSEDMDAIVPQINVENATCIKPENMVMIKGKIMEHHHSFEAFDTRLKLHLVLDPLSYKVDLEMLSRRSGGTKWKWQPVEEFLRGQGQGQARALCILAGAGTGKSTISAALTKQLLGRQDPKDGSWLGPASSVHFIKFSDQRRLEPVRIIKSLAYQLAVRLPAAAAAVLKLSPSAASRLRQPEDAFEQVLLPVVKAFGEAPVVLLIDALDEGDPPEEQKADFDSTDAKIYTVKACGNRVLSLLLGLLVKRLPPNVRFILTAWPEACCRGIEAALTRVFSGVTFLGPKDVRDDDGTRSGMLVFDTIVSECGLVGKVSAAVKGAPTIADLYAAYRAVFDSSPPSSRPAVMHLLQLLMAEQEPLSMALLQQMGVGPGELRLLPGWGCLFFEAEHHDFMVHKSLSDWLLLPKESNPYAPDVSAGHGALGAQLFKEASRVASDDAEAEAQLSDYCLKHAVLHLCEATGQRPESAQMLDKLLSNWGFLCAAIKAGHGGKLLAALGGAAASLSVYAADAYRWLGMCINNFEALKEVTREKVAEITVTEFPAPPRCHKLQEAARQLRHAWVPRLQLGGYGNEWSPVTLNLMGHRAFFTSVAFSPDGKQLATGSGDKTAKVWDLASGTSACPAILNDFLSRWGCK